MGQLKITENLFLHSAELNRLISFLDADGFRKLFTLGSASFGLVKDNPLVNFRLESGTAQGTLRLRTPSYAVNSDGNILTLAPFDNLPVDNGGAWFWAKISYQPTPNEVGTVSVDEQGNLSGVDTRFTDVLRGQPNFASVISFPDSQGNVQNYEVVQVLSDTQAILAGGAIYQAEAGMSYKVVGTFNPDFVPPLAVQDIFQYDGCKLELVPEITDNEAPQKLDGLEFYLARVRNDGAAVAIHDKRSEFWVEKGVAELQRLDREPNPLIGVEAIKWADDYSTRTDNLCIVGWGFRSDNWTTDPILNRLTLIGGNGGTFKSTATFVDGQFDGWRVYAADGTFTRVLSSQKTGTQINLTLEVLNPDKYTVGDLLTVVPDCEEVEVHFSHDTDDNDKSTLLDKVYTFPVQAGVGRCDVLVPADRYYYVMQYRTRQLNTYSPLRFLPGDPIGYYNETSFDADGVLYTDPAKVKQLAYRPNARNSGYVLFVSSPASFRHFTQKIDLGDLLGVNVRSFDNSNPVTQLVVGVDKQHQIFTGSIGLTVDNAVALSKVGAREGNVFYISFASSVNAGDYKIGVYSGYNNAGSTGKKLKVLSRTEVDYMGIPNRQVAVKCVYSGSEWFLTTLETDPSHLGRIEPFFDLSRSDFDEDGKGIGEEVLGYRLCTELAGKFIVGMDPTYFLDPTTDSDGDYAEIGKQGGSEEVTLTIEEIPEIDVTGNNLQARLSVVDGQSTGDFDGDQIDDSPTEPNLYKALEVQKPGGGKPHENRPPYYTVAYLQRVPYSG
jgi:hypothetical protein